MNNLAEAEILFVEDDPYFAELVLAALRRFRFDRNVLLMNDGADALSLINDMGVSRPGAPGASLKLIILDLSLPNAGGLEILRKVRSVGATKFIPVMILTSSTHERDMLQSYEVGANSYVIKPMDFEVLVDLIGTAGKFWLRMNRSVYPPDALPQILDLSA